MKVKINLIPYHPSTLPSINSVGRSQSNRLKTHAITGGSDGEVTGEVTGEEGEQKEREC